MRTLDQKDKIYLSTMAIVKGMTYEELKKSDDMYDSPKYIDEVWEYVDEIKDIGRDKFRGKYRGFYMFPQF